MNDELVEDIVTEFLLNTCRLRPQLTEHAVLQATLRCAQLAAQHPDDAEADFIPLTAGSVAEFYIEPMLPHIGDIDVMYHTSNKLAIPRGHPPPIQLPAEFHSYVRVFEINDSHVPGYVYLQLRYLLTECVDNGKYNTVEYDEEMYLVNRLLQCDSNDRYFIGPAFHHVFSDNLLPTDGVRCVRCLVWLRQAADWRTRHRDYGWPDSATVDRVVSNGCDVVGVAHRQCRKNEWMRKCQWRLSFSRAEIILINSWKPVQQIAYHMLRVFVKTERLTDSARPNSGESSLTNYHIKTLMLWACELTAQSWWTDNLNLVRICVHLLHLFGDWLTEAWCQHYFINNFNLIDNSFNVTNIGGQLTSIDATWLSKWFVDNYVRKCSELCPDNIFQLFDNISGSMKLQNAVSAVVVWRLGSTLLDTLRAFNFLYYRITLYPYKWHMIARSCMFWMDELANIDPRLSIYFTAVAFLHVVRKTSSQGLDAESTDILATLFGQIVYRQHYCRKSTILSSLPSYQVDESRSE